MTTQPQYDLLPLIVESIHDRKGQKITVVDLSDNESAPASRFIICQGRSTQNVASIADNIREQLLEKAGVKPYSYDGYTNSQWIVIDYGDTLIHVFLPEVRSLYDLEDLWSDAPIAEIPDLD